MNSKRLLFPAIGIALILAAACSNPFFPPKKGDPQSSGGNNGGSKVNAQTPQISEQPQDAVYGEGETAEPLSVTATVSDGGSLTYQWYSHTSGSTAAEISGATSANYTPLTNTLGEVWYYMVVTNTIHNNGDGGAKTASKTSQTAKVEVNSLVNAQPPNITAHPQGAEYNRGATATLSVSASVSDGGVLTYQWYSNMVDSNNGGAPIPGATSTSYTPPTDDFNTVWYYVVVTNTITDNDDGGKKTASVTSHVAEVVILDILIVRNLTEWDAAKTIISSGGNNREYIIRVEDTIVGIGIPGSTTNTFGMASYITVKLEGSGRLFLSSNGIMILLRANQTLIIDSADLTLQGRSNNTYPPVYVNSATAHLELRNGTISGNTTTATGSYGGGVYVTNGRFTMSGGTISGNSVRPAGNVSYGGGVYVTGGIFSMSGGTISGNTTQGNLYSYGGGVYIIGGMFTMSGGIISGNKSETSSTGIAPNAYGGGVYVTTGGSFNMSGGIIKDNTAYAISYYTNGGSNIAYGYGGGVAVHNNATFTMSGGEISANTAQASTRYPEAYGGGVAVYGTSSNFTMNGGTISENKTNCYNAHGAGVAARNGATFTMSGGAISGNTATATGTGRSPDGGGVHVSNESNFTMSGGAISGNSLAGILATGGGVYVSDTSSYFTMSGGEISGNSVTDSLATGGGVYVRNSGSFRIVTGTVYGSDEGVLSNTAPFNGAALCIDTTYSGTAQRGTFSGGTWNSKGSLSTTDNTIRVNNGDYVGIGRITAPLWRDGSAVTLSVPTVTPHIGQTVTAQGWQTSDNGSSGWSNFTSPTADLSYNGKYLRYYATNSGGDTLYSNTVTIRVISATAREVTIAMYDSGGDGWDGNGALRININGSDIATVVKVQTTAANNTPSGQRNTNTYTFFVESGDNVQLYWVAGTYQQENSFIAYYTDMPPSPAFTASNQGPTSWSGTNALVFRLRNTMTSITGGTLLGEFTVP